MKVNGKVVPRVPRITVPKGQLIPRFSQIQLSEHQRQEITRVSGRDPLTEGQKSQKREKRRRKRFRGKSRSKGVFIGFYMSNINTMYI